MARRALSQAYGLPDGANLVGPLTIGGRERLIAFLPHPNARGVRSFGKCFSAQEVARLQSFVGAGG